MAFPCRWSQQRQAFGKPLSSQAVVRAKLAQMIARIESSQSWLENITHQMNNVRPSLISVLNPRGLKLGPFVDVLCGAV